MSKLTISRVCQRCGKIFEATELKHYCADCLKQIKSESTYKERTCIDCGRNFMGYPKSKRCPNCNQEKIRERKQKQNKYGAKRPLGSIDTCVICGKEYIVKSPKQKYCSEICAKQGLKKYNSTYKAEKVNENLEEYKKREKELRRNTYNICKYCLRPFKSSIKNKMYCSQYCRDKAEKISYSLYAEKNRNGKMVNILLEEREEYRNQVANNPPE